MLRRLSSFCRSWWESPPLIDQFKSIHDSENVLELTEDMIVNGRGLDPFGRFKRMKDALSR